MSAKQFNNREYDYLWKKNPIENPEQKEITQIQNKLSYTKENLLNLLKRHSLKKEYKCCPFTANSIEMLLRFIMIENALPPTPTRRAISLSQEILNKACFSGKSRLTLAAALYYFACIYTGYRLNQYQIAALFFVTPVALRNRLKEIIPLIQNKMAKYIQEEILNRRNFSRKNSQSKDVINE